MIIINNTFYPGMSRTGFFFVPLSHLVLNICLYWVLIRYMLGSHFLYFICWIHRITTTKREKKVEIRLESLKLVVPKCQSVSPKPDTTHSNVMALPRLANLIYTFITNRSKIIYLRFIFNCNQTFIAHCFDLLFLLMAVWQTHCTLPPTGRHLRDSQG